MKRIEWLRAQIVETDECILWPYAAIENGYGYVRDGGRMRYVHHVALEAVGISPPTRGSGTETRHRCGVKLCFNPRHLLVGTSAENKADNVAQGRSNRGRRSGTAKLTESQVIAIRSAPGLHREIAVRFGVSQQTVSKIKAGHRWGWLQSST